MAVQQDLNLNVGLDPTKSAKLEQVNLTPDLAQAGLTLHGDYYNQRQAKFNRYVLGHPISLAVVAVVTSIYGYYQFSTIFAESSSIDEVFKHQDFLPKLVMCAPGFLCGLGLVGILGYLLSDDLKTVSENLEHQSYSTILFGFNLNGFASLSQTFSDLRIKKEKDLFKQGENSSILIYRDSPIAVATVKPLVEKSDEDTFYVQISGINVRKVFAKVDFDDLLLEWAIKRSKELALEDSKFKNAKLVILIDAYSFDSSKVKLLKSSFFEKISSTYVLNPFFEVGRAEKEYLSLGASEKGKSKPLKDDNKEYIYGIPIEPLYRLFDISRDTYALTINRKVASEKVGK